MRPCMYLQFLRLCHMSIYFEEPSLVAHKRRLDFKMAVLFKLLAYQFVWTMVRGFFCYLIPTKIYSLVLN